MSDASMYSPRMMRLSPSSTGGIWRMSRASLVVMTPRSTRLVTTETFVALLAYSRRFAANVMELWFAISKVEKVMAVSTEPSWTAKGSIIPS